MITKSEALAAMTARDEADQKRLDERVHDALLHYVGQPVKVDVGGYSQKAVATVVASARAAGWTVAMESGTGMDQRDAGPWLTFT